MAYLNATEVNDLCIAIINGTDPVENRSALYQSVDGLFRAAMPHGGGGALAKLMTEIGYMNQIERITSGQVPLQIFLQNAALLVSDSAGSVKVVREMLDKVTQLVSGAPALGITNMLQRPEMKEVIIHTDDTVTFAYMQAAVKAASSVYKLRVPAYENGVARLTAQGAPFHFLGTGWLLADSLLMTNHHVINARQDGEGFASQQDLLLQASGTGAIADFDIEGMEENPPLQAMKLEAWHMDLDYAVLRIPTTGRPALRRNNNILNPQQTSVPVNIIQHPGGRSKRYGIRNNLVFTSTPTELCYFTDTEGGASGSPVLNDKWEVVALHRAAKYVDNVKFQGKDTAYVNIGTHLKLIMDDIAHRFPALAAEIA
jgi:endonuclease G, mitochondrial